MDPNCCQVLANWEDGFLNSVKSLPNKGSEKVIPKQFLAVFRLPGFNTDEYKTNDP